MALSRPDAATTRWVDGVNDFGCRLLTRLQAESPGANVFISPFSIAMVLGVLWNGAEGATRQAIAKVLGWSGWDRQEEVNAASASLLALQQGEGIRLLTANSLWAAQQVALAPAFVDLLRQFYAGEATAVDFSRAETADTINRWTAERTEGRIDRLVTSQQLFGAILAVVNAVYFKGLWAQPFQPSRTREGIFHRLDDGPKNVPLMHASGTYDYFQDGEVQAVSLPYGDGSIAMDVILPHRETFPDVRAGLTAARWRHWVKRLGEHRGELALPRFRAGSRAELSAALNGLGMGVAFTPEADFRGIGAGSLMISQVLHETLVQVNEEGTEAAAATAAIMTRGMVERFQMTIDRPFFCVIRHVATNAGLFMGFIMNPE